MTVVASGGATTVYVYSTTECCVDGKKIEDR